MVTYQLILSQTFPATHPRKGEPTEFYSALRNTLDFLRYDLSPVDFIYCKLHTIRANYPLWKKRFEKIARGEACLSIRQWEGKPRRSKTIEIARLTKDDGIGLQRLDFKYGLLHAPIVDYRSTMAEVVLANNDGLSLEDWEAWFAKADTSKPMAIIQFSKFRY